MPQTGVWCQALELERAMGIGPTVSSLARKRFTGKLRPLLSTESVSWTHFQK